MTGAPAQPSSVSPTAPSELPPPQTCVSVQRTEQTAAVLGPQRGLQGERRLGWMGTQGGGRGGSGHAPRARSLRPRRVLQKWQCVEDTSGRLKLHKCKGPARLGGRALSNLVPKYYGQGGEACVCAGSDYKLSLAGRRKKFFKKSKCSGPGPSGEAGGGIVPGEPRSFVQTAPRVALRKGGGRPRGEGRTKRRQVTGQCAERCREHEPRQGRGRRERGPQSPSSETGSPGWL